MTRGTLAKAWVLALGGAVVAADCGGTQVALDGATDLGQGDGGRDGGVGEDGGVGDGGSPDGSVTPRPAYYVEGGRLHDPCGVEVVLRGVNKMAVYQDRKGDSFPEIAKTGANVVRFMWFSTVAPDQAVQTIQRAIDAQLIPMWDLHDATGDFSKIPLIEAYWTRPDTLEVLRRFESRLLVNIANEAGQRVADETYKETYIRIIGKLRAAGLRMPLVVDAAGYGRNVEQLLALAPDILAADPLGNVVFSWHAYDSDVGQAARIDKAFATARDGKLALVIGEFASVTPGACSKAVPYVHLMTSAQAQGIGYLAWSWDNFNGDCKMGDVPSPLDMVADGIHLSTLKPGWATEVVVTDPSGIGKTSKRTFWQTSKTATCGP